jgi:TerB N-terminal domain/TerB-C domain
MERLLLCAVLVGFAHSAAAQGSWYYCEPAHAYYPYVNNCPVPWREIAPYAYRQDQQQAVPPPLARPAAPALDAPAPTVPSQPEPEPSAIYSQGRADRGRLEGWFGSLTGDYRAGAEYWAGHRSSSNRGLCNGAPPSTGPDWTAGCIAAQQRLAAPDGRRKTEPNYRLGWNAPAPLSASPRDANVPATQTPVPTPSATLAAQLPMPQSDSNNSRQPSPADAPRAEADTVTSPSSSPAAVTPQPSAGGWIAGVAVGLIAAAIWKIRKAYRTTVSRGGPSQIAAKETYRLKMVQSAVGPAYRPSNQSPEATIGLNVSPHQQPGDLFVREGPELPSGGSPGHEERTSVPSTIPLYRLVIEVGSRSIAKHPIRQPRREDARWTPPGKSVNVNGFDIPGGMVYVGSFMPAAPGGGIGGEEPAPCLINPSLKVGAGKPRIGTDMGYWPSYNGIEPAHRLNYLHWLSEGKRDSSFPVGYAFLYFYGLERRLLADTPSPEEEALLVVELERLRNLYATNRSFLSYSTALIDVVQLRRLSTSPPGLDGWRPSLPGEADAIPMPLRLKLGVMAAMGKPLDFDHAMAAMLTRPQYQGGIRRVIGMTRTRSEFLDLARRRFATQFPAGLPLRDKKDSSLKLTYNSASRHLEVGIRVQGIARVPDPLDLVWKDMIELCNRVAEDLTPYAKAVGKARIHGNSLEAALALPEDFGDTASIDAFKRWLGNLPTPFAEVPLTTLGRWCFGEGKAAEGMKQAQQISAILARVGYGMEPDPTYGAPKPRDTTVLFRAPTTAGAASVASQHAGLIAAVLASEDVTADHCARIASELGTRLGLDPAETIRIAGRLRATRGHSLAVSGLTKIGQSMTLEERTAVAVMSVTVATVCGEVDRATITALERLHDAFGVERRGLYALLHQGAAAIAARATEPVVVEQSSKPDVRFRIPPPHPTPAVSGEFAIDMARVSEVLRETREVAQVLAPIYDEDEAIAGSPVVAAPKVPSGSRFPGLGAEYAHFLGALCSKGLWSRADYQSKARDFGLLPDGAIEAINEWAYDELGDELIADDDPLTINMTLLPRASEEAA